MTFANNFDAFVVYVDIPGKLTRRFRGKLTSRLAGEERQKML